MCHASYKTSMTRRETLKDVINSNYRSVCGQNTPLGKCLFGDELPKHIKDIAEVNKMSKKILVQANKVVHLLANETKTPITEINSKADQGSRIF